MLTGHGPTPLTTQFEGKQKQLYLLSDSERQVWKTITQQVSLYMGLFHGLPISVYFISVCMPWKII